MKSIKYFAIVAVTAILAAACSSRQEKTDNDYMIQGNIAGTEGTTAYVESPNALGAWYAVDTFEIDGDGNFCVIAPRPAVPEIYRLKVSDKVLYLPIDSTETLTVKADTANWGMYVVDGSYNAKTLADISHKITELRSTKSPQEVAADPTLKKYLNDIIVSEIQKGNDRNDQSGILAYYIVAVCNVDGVPVYDPARREDLRVIGAVANDFKECRPDDPRAKYLEGLFVNNRNSQRISNVDINSVTDYEVPMVSLIDFTLPDQNNNQQSLSKLASNGKVTLLNFTSYGLPNSTYINNVLKGLYDKYKDKGFEIVQVGVADDPYSWAHSRNGLPWVTLYGESQTVGSVLLSYGVEALPQWFLIDRGGELKMRIDNIEELRGAIEKQL